MNKLSTSMYLVVLASLALAESPDKVFLQENAQKDGVVVLPSGLQYKVLISGPTEGESPGLNHKCFCHYAGRLIDGTEFDSSLKRGKPSGFKPSEVIKGWTEALQMMRAGDKWELYIPSDLAYGPAGRGGTIPGDATLIFELELIGVKWPQKGTFHIYGLPFAETMDSPLMFHVPTWVCILILIVWVIILGGPKEMMGIGDSVTAYHILSKSRQQCVMLKKELDEVAKERPYDLRDEFAEIARKVSICNTKENGGFLGSFGRGHLKPELDKACWEAPVNEVQGPVESKRGYHLVLVTSKDNDKDK